jgi:hypothetical protein
MAGRYLAGPALGTEIPVIFMQQRVRRAGGAAALLWQHADPAEIVQERIERGSLDQVASPGAKAVPETARRLRIPTAGQIRGEARSQTGQPLAGCYLGTIVTGHEHLPENPTTYFSSSCRHLALETRDYPDQELR